jgi:hypothetical protein
LWFGVTVQLANLSDLNEVPFFKGIFFEVLDFSRQLNLQNGFSSTMKEELSSLKRWMLSEFSVLFISLASSFLGRIIFSVFLLFVFPFVVGFLGHLLLFYVLLN